MRDWTTKCLETLTAHQNYVAVNGDSWSIRQTAKTLGRSKTQVAEDIRLAYSMLRDPILKTVDRQEAVRRITAVQHWCSSCKLPNVEHVTQKECISALAQELERYRDCYNQVRRLSREMVSELEDF